MGKPEGKKPLGRSSHKWENNIKIDFKEIGRAGVGWIERARVTYKSRAVVKAVMKLWAPCSAGNFSTS